jgi:acyl carrier protein phosphodiesterase
MTLFLVSACATEIKPVLKPVEVDIPNRIVNLQKWLAMEVEDKIIEFKDAKPIQDKLNEIKQRYDRLQSAGALTAKDSKEIAQMLDAISDQIFRLDQRKKKGKFQA